MIIKAVRNENLSWYYIVRTNKPIVMTEDCDFKWIKGKDVDSLEISSRHSIELYENNGYLILSRCVEPQPSLL